MKTIKLKSDLYNKIIELQKKYIIVKWKKQYEYGLVDIITADVYSIDKEFEDLKQLWFKSLESDFFRLFYDEKIEIKEEEEIKNVVNQEKKKILTPEQMKAKLSGEKTLF